MTKDCPDCLADTPIVERVRAAAAKCGLRNGIARDMRIIVSGGSGGTIILAVSFSVLDFATGEPSHIHQATAFAAEAVASIPADAFESFVMQEVYNLVRSAYLHELDEAFTVNGVAVFDPHAERREGRHQALARALASAG